jgi:hypothetical protein
MASCDADTHEDPPAWARLTLDEVKHATCKLSNEELVRWCQAQGIPIELGGWSNAGERLPVRITIGEPCGDGSRALVFGYGEGPDQVVRVPKRHDTYTILDAVAHLQAHRRLPKYIVEPKRFILIQTYDARGHITCRLATVMARLEPHKCCACHYPTAADRAVLQRLVMAAVCTEAQFRHGDLSGNNIIQTWEGPKMIDIDASSLFQSGLTEIATWQYLPPEALSVVSNIINNPADRGLGARSRIVFILRQIATGEAPPEPGTEQEVIQVWPIPEKHCFGAIQSYIHAAIAVTALTCEEHTYAFIESLGDLVGKLHVDVQALLRECLAPESSCRPRGAALAIRAREIAARLGVEL